MPKQEEEKAVEERKPFGERAREWTNGYLTSVFAELSPKDLRKMFRGEPPGRPNPRYKPHNVSFWFHMKPRWYPKSVTKFTYTFGLGWTSVFVAVVLGLSGALLMLFYKPSVDTAYFDILNILGNVPFGKFMRDIHRLGAEIMVAVVALHMLRVFVTGSYKQPRSFNWTVGVVLLLVTLVFSYTGYLLPWDQLAYWAVTIGASMVSSIPVVGTQLQELMFGGAQIDQLGLIRLYTLHIAVLPLALFIMFSVHFHKVVRQNISLPPAVEAGDKEDKERVSFLPEVFSREALWVVGLLFIMFLVVRTFFSAPLEGHADPYVTPLHATAPWYFLWIQGLIKLPDIFGGIIEGKFIYGVVIPGIVFGFLFILPYIDRNPSRRWQDRKLALAIAAVSIVTLGVLTWMGSPAYKAQATPQEEIALEFVPYDREGHIHEVPWEELEELTNASYETETAVTGAATYPEHFGEFMLALSEAIEKDLPGGTGLVTITIWQSELNRVDLDLTWPEDGEQRTFNQYTYIHQNTAP